MKVAVSFIKSKYNEKETIEKINETSADYLHLDIMDGLFVKNKNYSFLEIKSFLENNKKPLDVHLMCENPEIYFNDYLSLNPDTITFHIEAVKNPIDLINYLHLKNVKCGIAINPDTSIELIKPYLRLIDKVLVMSVYPGLGGQTFIDDTICKIDELFDIKENFVIEVDGGINDIVKNKLNKVDILVSGSFICESDNYEKQVLKLK